MSTSTMSRSSNASRTLPPTRYDAVTGRRRRAASCWVGESDTKKRSRRAGTAVTAAHCGAGPRGPDYFAPTATGRRYWPAAACSAASSIVCCSIMSRRSCGVVDAAIASRRSIVAVLVQAEQALVERLHAVVLALGDDLLDLVRLVGVDDLVEHAAGRHEHLDRRRPTARALLDEALAHDAAQRRRERHADLALLVRREEVDDAVDRVGRADRVQRREHEVTGLGRGQRGLHGLDVADLTDEDDVGVLAEHALQRGVEVGGVGADLALVDDRALVGVQDLDRVLDRDDVPVVVVVDEVDHRAERRRLSRTGRTGDEDEPALVIGELADDGRQTERLERRDVALHAPQHETDRAALAHDVHAEAAEARHRVREVGLGARR